jgi:hypothetical protein|tara:strand:- start:9595 stop:9849 length:255 start_codon:yes stop_codon:yes gene_type:complete
MAIQIYNKQGNSKIVENHEVQTMLKSGWSFKKPAVKVCANCSNEQCVCTTETESKTKSTKRPKPILQIKEANAEVIKPYNKEDN